MISSPISSIFFFIFLTFPGQSVYSVRQITNNHYQIEAQEISYMFLTTTIPESLASKAAQPIMPEVIPLIKYGYSFAKCLKIPAGRIRAIP